jgi:AraC-like DNA-binding protein
MMPETPGAICTFQSPIVPFIRQGEFAVRRPWHVSPRRLLDYLLIFVQEGQCTIVVEGTTYHFQAGEFCLIQPNDLHSLEGTTNTVTPYVHLDMFYNPRREESFPTVPGQVELSAYRDLLQPRLNDWKNIHIPVKFVPAHPTWFRETLLVMVSTWQQRDVVSQLEAQHYATALVLSLLKEYLLPGEILQASPSLHWILSYLSFHLAEPISIAEMANYAHLSPSHFARLFRQQFGLAPHQYLLHLRLQHAQSLLLETRLTLAKIVEYCGFSDVHHFSKVFRKHIGCSPGAYREDGTQRER